MAIEKKVFRSGPYADLFCQGVRVGDTLYMAGQVGTDENGSAPEDLVAQMKHAYAHVQSVLAEYGVTMDNVVDETWFVTDIDIPWRKSGIFARAEIYGKKPEVSQTLVRLPDWSIRPSKLKSNALLACNKAYNSICADTIAFARKLCLAYKGETKYEWISSSFRRCGHANHR